MEFALNLWVVMGISAISALGLNIITGMCGQASLGQAAFVGIGAYTCAVLAQMGWPVQWLIPASAILAGAVGLLGGLLSLRVRDDFLAITTMGLGFVFIGVVRKQEFLGGEMGISDIPIVGYDIPALALLVFIFVVLTLLLSWHLERSWLGFNFAVIADDEEVAHVLGVDVQRHKLLAFCLGTMLAGIAGCLYTLYTRFIVPDSFGFIMSISALAMVTIGGVGSTFGVFFAALILTAMPEVFRAMNDYKLMIYGGLLLLVMRFASEGLAGMQHKLRKYWRLSRVKKQAQSLVQEN